MVITMGYTKKEFPALFTLITALLVLWSVSAYSAGLKDPESTEVTLKSKIKITVAADEAGQQEQKKVYIQIITDKGRFYILPDTTVSKGGKMISMEKLPVPCKARITYQPLRRNSGNALKIEITAVLKGASTEWSQPAPE